MVEPDHDADQPEQLTGGDRPRVNWTAVAAAVVLLAGGILLARVDHHGGHRPVAQHRTAEKLPLPTPVPRVHLGSVFLEHLLQCTRTDHRHHLSVALGVTNLGGNPLELVGAMGVSSNAVLVEPIAVRIGSQPCAGAPAKIPFRLAPGAGAVVSLGFRIGAACPRHALVSARVAFDAGQQGVLHADSAQLADLDRLDFVQCA